MVVAAAVAVAGVAVVVGSEGCVSLTHQAVRIPATKALGERSLLQVLQLTESLCKSDPL